MKWRLKSSEEDLIGAVAYWEYIYWSKDSLRILPIRIWTWVTSVWMIHEPIWDTGDLGSTRPQGSQEPKGTHLEIIVLHRVDQKEQIITSWQAWKLLSQFETMIHLLLNRLLTWTTGTHRKKIEYFSFLKTAVHQKNSSPLKTRQSTDLQMKNNVYVPSSLS